MGCLSCISVIIVVFLIMRKVLPWIYFNIGPIFLGPKIDVKSLGEWAVVTGATDGIGKAYAQLFAKKGMKVLLISRNPTKLNTVATELIEKYNVEVAVSAVDFTDGPHIYDQLKTELQPYDIGVLVNNVGISYPHPEFFVETYKANPKFLLDIVAANIHSVTHLCGIVLPSMMKKHKGLIINVSSTSAVIPNALLSVYSGTKAFVDKFTTDLQTECQYHGIILQSVQPGFVATNMTKIRKPTLFAPSADQYVESAVKTIGIAGSTAGYWVHSCLQLVIHLTATLLGEKFARNLVFKNLLTTRKRAMRNLNPTQ